MEIVTVDELDTEDIPHVTMINLFDESLAHGTKTKFGKVVIPPGVRVPLEGMSKHDADEYSIIIQGSIKTNSGGRDYHVSAGQATFIPMGEEHYAYNDGKEDCIIIYALVKK